MVISDIAIFYLSLFLTLAVRNSFLLKGYAFNVHFEAFSVVFAVWLVIFYIAGLYEIEHFFSLKELRGRIFNTMLSALAIAVLIFYIVPSFGITPKTVLILETLMATVIIWIFRRIVFTFAKNRVKLRIFFAKKNDETESENKEMDSFIELLQNRPQLGYKILDDQKEARLIVVSEESRKNPSITENLYSDILEGKTVMSFSSFYETVLGKVPVYAIDKGWFLENLMEINKETFETFKRFFDVGLSLLAIIPIILVTPFIALVIKLSSPGPVFFRQKRAGKNGKVFELVKFRSMTIDAENGAYRGWTKLASGDKRITTVGKFMRRTRLDELPQLWNILKGEMAVVGPRPERPEFVTELEKQIPHYSIRHITKPGVTGWGQIHFSTASASDALEKLQYDLYYIKNRSLALEVGIILKTIFILFRREGR